MLQSNVKIYRGYRQEHTALQQRKIYRFVVNSEWQKLML